MRFHEIVTAAPLRKAEPFCEARVSMIDTPVFRAWFGSSKVVWPDGTPMVVYHGTRHDFDVFDLERAAAEGGAFFFSRDSDGWRGRDARAAGTYASGPGGNIMPVYLKMENPLVTGFTLPEPADDASDADLDAWIKKQRRFDKKFDNDQFKTIYFRDAISLAKRTGRDGVIIKHVTDDAYHSEHSSQPSDIYIVFDSKQIKSAIGNRGTFDPASPNVMEAAPVPPAATRFLTKLGVPLRLVSRRDDPDLLVADDLDPALVDFKPGDESRRTAERRSLTMIDDLQQGGTLPPVYLILKADGRFEVSDGNARLTAYRATGRRIPHAVIMDGPGKHLQADSPKLRPAHGLTEMADRSLDIGYDGYFNKMTQHVVWREGDLFLSVNDPQNATRVWAWDLADMHGGNIGMLHTKGENPPGYLEVVSANLSGGDQYKKRKLGSNMYRALLNHLGPQYRGISSYLPHRSNTNEVPKIYQRLGGHRKGEFAFIDRPETPFVYTYVER